MPGGHEARSGSLEGIATILGGILLIGVLAYKGAESFFAGNANSPPQAYQSCGSMRMETDITRLKDGGCKTYFSIGATPAVLPGPSSVCTFYDEGVNLVRITTNEADPSRPTAVNRDGSDDKITLGFVWYEKPHPMCDKDNEYWQTSKRKSAKTIK